MGLFGNRDRKLWVSNAQPEEQGSFCDTNSQHEYINKSNFEAEVEIRRADERGEEPVIVDDSSFDGRSNLYYSETDGQGSDHPRKYDPAR